MLVTAFRDGQNISGMENHRLWDAPTKRTSNGSDGAQEQMDLIRGMYERIVVLEQQYREQSLKVERLTVDLSKVDAQKYCDGVLVWQLDQFHNQIDLMSNNPNILLYSTEAYTSPHGYKFCARLNISSKVSVFLIRSKGVNDYFIEFQSK